MPFVLPNIPPEKEGLSRKDPDAQTELEIQNMAIRNKREQAEVDGIVQDNNQRRRYAGYILFLVVAWLLVVLLVVVACGRQCLHLSDAVLIALISTTTVNVVALFAIVAHYLFPNRDRRPPQSQ